MISIGLIFPSVDVIQEKLLEDHGKDYAVVVVLLKQGVRIYDDPHQITHPVGEYDLESNLIGARIKHGENCVLLVRAA